MKKLIVALMLVLLVVGIVGPVKISDTDAQVEAVLVEAQKIQAEILELTMKYESEVAELQLGAVELQFREQPPVILAGSGGYYVDKAIEAVQDIEKFFGCTPAPKEKPKPKPEPEKPEIIKPTPPPPSTIPSLPVVKPVVKKPAVVKVTRKGNEWTLKLNTNKIQKGYEVHLCVGYLYFPVQPSQIKSDGTVKITTDWLPPDNPRVSAGVWNGGGQYVSSMLVEG